MECDVVCLQEVTLPLKEQLEKLKGWNVVSRKDFSCLENGSPCYLYLVTLSRRDILSYKEHTLSPKRDCNAWKIVKWGRKWNKNHGYQCIEIPNIKKKGIIRIFNTHLENLAGPTLRFFQLKSLLSNMVPGHDRVYCGDFNSFSNPWISWFIGPWLGFSYKDYVINEQEALLQKIRDHGLYAGKYQFTYPVFGPLSLNLDFIFSSRPIIHSTVVENRYGSDHHPVLAEISV